MDFKLNLKTGYQLSFILLVSSFMFTRAAANNILLFFTVLFFIASSDRSTFFNVIKKDITARTGAILFLFFVFSLFWNGLLDNSIKFLFKYREFFLIGIFSAIMLEKSILKIILKSHLIASLAVLIASYLMFYDLWFWQNGNWNSLHARIFHGLVMNILLMFSLYQISYKDKHKIVYSIISLAVFINLFFIEPGRSSQLTMVAILFIFIPSILNKLPHKSKIISICLTAILAIVVIISFYYSTGSRFTDLEIINDESRNFTENFRRADIRASWYANGLELALKKPLQGHGLGNVYQPFNDLILQRKKDGISEGFHAPVQVHNQFLQTFIETGVIGLALFVFFVFSILKMKGTPKPVIFGSFVIVLVYNLFNSSFLDHGNGYILLLLLSVLIAKKIIKREA